ncbi:hypothetical protein, partial [Rothia dentocariosa]|uniref:hypothetical protein n=1 Tax=Rothia dentocariosa TaxID=2047 RepID=UPI00195534FE
PQHRPYTDAAPQEYAPNRPDAEGTKGRTFRAREGIKGRPEWRPTPAPLKLSQTYNATGITSAPPIYGRSASGIRT